MTQIHPDALDYERKRWMRSDAHQFVRNDWRHFARPGSELEALYDFYERKYSPDQPRVPRGQPEGGQWAAEDSGDGASSTSNSDGQADPNTTELSAAGHHKVPKGVYEKYPLPPETRAVFDQATTGKLLDPSSNLYDSEHRAYNEAIKQEFEQYLKTNQIDPAKMTPDQAREFLGKIFISEDPRIREFNMRMQIREIRRFIFRRMRGFE